MPKSDKSLKYTKKSHYYINKKRGCPKSIWHPRFIRIPIGD